MSFRITMQCFESYDASVFKRSIAWDIFGPRAHLVTEGWLLRYAGVYQGILSLNDAEFITGVSINRPGDLAIADLYKIACVVPSLIMWNDVGAVAHARYLTGFPDRLLRGFRGPPTVVTSASDLLTLIGQTA